MSKSLATNKSESIICRSAQLFLTFRVLTEVTIEVLVWCLQPISLQAPRYHLWLPSVLLNISQAGSFIVVQSQQSCVIANVLWWKCTDYVRVSLRIAAFRMLIPGPRSCWGGGSQGVWSFITLQASSEEEAVSLMLHQICGFLFLHLLLPVTRHNTPFILESARGLKARQRIPAGSGFIETATLSPPLRFVSSL